MYRDPLDKIILSLKSGDLFTRSLFFPGRFAQIWWIIIGQRPGSSWTKSTMASTASRLRWVENWASEWGSKVSSSPCPCRKLGFSRLPASMVSWPLVVERVEDMEETAGREEIADREGMAGREGELTEEMAGREGELRERLLGM